MWDKVKADKGYLSIFASLGTNSVLPEEAFNSLNDIVCTFYGLPLCHDVDQARYKIFWSNYKKGIIVDQSVLAPCTQSLKLHCSHANYVSRMWRYASSPKLGFESPTLHGWNEDLSLKWVK